MGCEFNASIQRYGGVINGYDVAAIVDYLVACGYRQIRDFTESGGCIWVLTYRVRFRDSEFFEGLEERFGARFHYRPEGGRRANRNRGPAWWFNPRNELGSRWANCSAA